MRSFALESNSDRQATRGEGSQADAHEAEQKKEQYLSLAIGSLLIISWLYGLYSALQNRSFLLFVEYAQRRAVQPTRHHSKPTVAWGDTVGSHDLFSK